MTKVAYYRNWLSKFISSEKGQRFFNFAYSIGAAIVIWGALFKILHLPGGNTLLSIGMGTEVLMFVLTAFDRPPKEYDWEAVFPQLKKDGATGEDEPAKAAVPAGGDAHVAGSVSGSGSIIINGSLPGAGGNVVINGGGGDSVAANGDADMAYAQSSSSSPAATASAPAAAHAIPIPTNFGEATQLYIDQITQVSEGLQKLQDSTEALNKVSETLLNSYQAITEHSGEINDSSNGYVAQMQALSHNITGLNTIYEIQLKSVSSQLDAIDRVNRGIKEIRDMFERSAEQSSRYYEETEKMAKYMQQLNSIYERMITAMTINQRIPTNNE